MAKTAGVPGELRAMLDDALGTTHTTDAPVMAALAGILERHEQIVREQVRAERGLPELHVAEHAIGVYAYPWTGGRRPYYIGAVCACGWAPGLNAIRWQLLAIQWHMIEHGYAEERGALADNEQLERQLDNARRRIELARRTLIDDGYFTEDEVGDDIAPRITELCSHMRRQLDAGMPAPLLEALDQLRVLVRALASPEDEDDVEAGQGAP